MGLYKKKNITIQAVGRLLFPDTLWTRSFLAAWLGCIATVLMFDLLWCGQTTFRALGFPGTWINLLALSTLMALPSALTPRRWIQATVMVLYALLSIANLMYCLTYFNSIPLASYALAGNLADFGASIIDSLRWRYLLMFVPVGVWLVWSKNRRDEKLPEFSHYLALFLVLVAISTANALAVGGLHSHVAKLQGECYYATTPPVIYTIPGNLMAESRSNDAPLTAQRRAELAQWGADHVELSKNITYNHTDTVSRRNMVVILCESLESWPIEAKVEGKELTPNINKLLADTAHVWYAPKVLSQAGNGRSIDGQLLMLAGMYPMLNEVFAMHYPLHRYMALPQAMAQQGANTYLLSGDKPSTWNQGLIARAFGIDHTYMADAWNNSETIGHPRRISDASFFQQAAALMQRGEVWPEGSPAYVQLVTYTGHNPFRIPDELKTIRFDSKYPDRLADYMTAVHYTDQALGHFISYLQSRSDWPNTIVSIMGDHEGLAGRRMAMRSSAIAEALVADGGYVPLIVVNGAEHGRYNHIMGQVDVYSTLLDQASLPFSWRGMGFSALADGAPHFAISPSGVLVGDTIGVSKALVDHVMASPAVSNDVIKYDLVR